MDDVVERLRSCFRLVFPDLAEADIVSATPQSIHGWDSVAAITLANVLEDEFGMEMELDALADLDSFGKIHAYLLHRLSVT